MSQRMESPDGGTQNSTTPTGSITSAATSTKPSKVRAPASTLPGPGAPFLAGAPGSVGGQSGTLRTVMRRPFARRSWSICWRIEPEVFPSWTWPPPADRSSCLSWLTLAPTWVLCSLWSFLLLGLSAHYFPLHSQGLSGGHLQGLLFPRQKDRESSSW